MSVETVEIIATYIVNFVCVGLLCFLGYMFWIFHKRSLKRFDEQSFYEKKFNDDMQAFFVDLKTSVLDRFGDNHGQND